MEEKRVEVNVPRGDARDESAVYVAVNGVSCLLPKGKRSAVPPEIAAEYARALRAREAQAEKIDALLDRK